MLAWHHLLQRWIYLPLIAITCLLAGFYFTLSKSEFFHFALLLDKTNFQSKSMASSTSRIVLRIVIAVLLLLALFYVGRPLYWKISATIHDIRHSKQTVQQGISKIMHEAQKSVGWFHDESDSGVHEDPSKQASRRLLF